jgi:hypothetical protein
MQITYSDRHPHLLYALTVSGVAYILKIKKNYNYAYSSVFPLDELIEFNIHTYYFNHGAITTVAATAGCFAVGFSDGSVSCFQLGILDQNAPGTVKLQFHLLYCIFNC